MHLFTDELALKAGVREGADPVLELPVVCELANEFLLSVPPPGFDAEGTDQMLAMLLRNASPSLTIEVAERLAHVDAGPVQTIRQLARHACPEVAVPVLRYSVLLSDDDLAAIASARPADEGGECRLAAIASRFYLTSRITDLLIEQGTPDVLDILAANATARFTVAGLRKLANRTSRRAFDADERAGRSREAHAPRAVKKSPG